MSRTNAPPRLCAIRGWFGMSAFIETDEGGLTGRPEDRPLTAVRPASSRPRARFGRRANAGLGDRPPRLKDAEEDPGEEPGRRGDDGRARGSCRAGFLSLPKPEAPGPRREKSARMPRVRDRECERGRVVVANQKPETPVRADSFAVRCFATIGEVRKQPRSATVALDLVPNRWPKLRALRSARVPSTTLEACRSHRSSHARSHDSPFPPPRLVSPEVCRRATAER